MSNFSFRQFLEFAMKQATRIFNRTGQLCPMYHAVSSAGEDYVFPALPGDKDVSTAAARAFLVSIEATRVAFIDEAWMMESAAGIDRDKFDREGVAKQPGRIEVILISAERKFAVTSGSSNTPPHRDGAQYRLPLTADVPAVIALLSSGPKRDLPDQTKSPLANAQINLHAAIIPAAPLAADPLHISRHRRAAGTAQVRP